MQAIVLIPFARALAQDPPKSTLQSWASMHFIKNLPFSAVLDINPEISRLISGDAFWRSYSVDNCLEYYPNNSWDIFAGFNPIYTYQEEGTNSLELRPYIGARYNILKPEKRVFLYFQAKYEFRFLHYYDSTPDNLTTRLRLSPMIRISLNRKSNLEDKNLMLRLSTERFLKLDEETDERFWFRHVSSAGLYYRQSHAWRYEFRYQIMKTKNQLDESKPSSVDHVLYFIVSWFL